MLSNLGLQVCSFDQDLGMYMLIADYVLYQMNFIKLYIKHTIVDWSILSISVVDK